MPQDTRPPAHGSPTEEREAFLEFVAEGLPASRSARFQDLFGLWTSGFATEGHFVTIGSSGPGYSDSQLLESLGWSGVSVERLAGPEAGTVNRLLEQSDAPEQIDFLSVELSVDDGEDGVEALRGLDVDRYRIRTVAVHPAESRREEVDRLLRELGYRRTWPRLSGSRLWYVLKGLEPRPRGEAQREALLRRLAELPPFEQGLEDRRRIVSDLTDRLSQGRAGSAEIVTSAAALEVADYPEPRHRAAVIQFEAGHEDGVVAVAHLLRMNGVEPTIYLNRRIRSHRPGFKARFPELAESTRFVRLDEGRDWWRLQQMVRDSGADLVVVNTFEHQGPANWAAEWDGLVLGVVHDPGSVLESDACRALIDTGRIGLLTLAPHVTSYLMEADPVLFGSVATITYAYPRPPEVQPTVAPGRRFAVPGTVTFDSRDYQQLLDVLPGISAELGDNPFDVCVVGGGRDRKALEGLVAARGLGDHFHFAEANEHGFVSQGDYFSLLRGSTFMLPLGKGRKLAFRRRKITSSIPAAASLGLPPVIDRWTATVYDVPSITYTVGEIREGLMRALTMTDAEIDELKLELEVHRERDMARASREMGYALRRVGLDVSPVTVARPRPEVDEPEPANRTDRLRRYVRRRS